MISGYNTVMHFIRKITAACLLLPLWNICPVSEEETEEAEETEEIYGFAELTDDLYSDYAVVIDRDTGQILSEKHADDIIYPASTTKMMSVILAIEAIEDPSERILITDNMWYGLYEANASVAGFMPGDEPTALELMYGAALPSGADACNALAVTVGGSIEDFVDMMNEKAAEIGMENTHFVNTTGLDDEDHYSTCRDMLKLLLYCIDNPLFAEIFSAEHYQTGSLQSAPDGIHLYSTSWSAIRSHEYSAPGYIGGKTGTTGAGGHCLAYWASLNGMNTAAVTMHAVPDGAHIYDMNTIQNKLEDWNRRPVISEGSKLCDIKVTHSCYEETIPVIPDDIIELDLPEDAETTIETDLPEQVNALVNRNSYEGNYTVRHDDEILWKGTFTFDVPPENFIGEYVSALRELNQ